MQFHSLQWRPGTLSQFLSPSLGIMQETIYADICQTWPCPRLKSRPTSAQASHLPRAESEAVV